MSIKVVCAIDETGVVIRQYPVSFGLLNAATSDADFIKEAQQSFLEDGGNLSDVTDWVVTER